MVVVVVVVMMGFVGVLEVKVLVVAQAGAVEIDITKEQQHTESRDDSDGSYKVKKWLIVCFNSGIHVHA